MSPARIREALKVFGSVFIQGYGQIETSFVSFLRNHGHDPNKLERPSSCGTPVAGMFVKILDDDHNEVPTGEVGENCVRGPQVLDEYRERPEETAAAFRSGWLRTGDMAKHDKDGYITIVDRGRDMIISGGFNIYPHEFEDVLTLPPAVALCAVIGLPDENWGKLVKAVAVLKPKAEATAEEPMDFL